VGETQGHYQSDGVSESINTRQMRFKWSVRVKQKTRENIEGNVFHQFKKKSIRAPELCGYLTLPKYHTERYLKV